MVTELGETEVNYGGGGKREDGGGRREKEASKNKSKELGVRIEMGGFKNKTEQKTKKQSPGKKGQLASQKGHEEKDSPESLPLLFTGQAKQSPLTDCAWLPVHGQPSDIQQSHVLDEKM